MSNPTANLKLTLKAWPVVTLLTIGLCYLTQLVAGWFGIDLPEQGNVDAIKRMLGWNWRFFVNLVLILVALPIVEELIFRGLCFKLPLRKLSSVIRLSRLPMVFALVSAVLFSAAHYAAQPFPDNAFLALAFFGLAQCWLYRKTDRIWCPMLNHALFNLTNLALLFILIKLGVAS